MDGPPPSGSAGGGGGGGGRGRIIAHLLQECSCHLWPKFIESCKASGDTTCVPIKDALWHLPSIALCLYMSVSIARGREEEEEEEEEEEDMYAVLDRCHTRKSKTPQARRWLCRTGIASCGGQVDIICRSTTSTQVCPQGCSA